MFHSKLSGLVLMLLMLIVFVSLPSSTVYHPYQTQVVMSNADGSGVQLGTVDAAHDYRVVSYNWNPWATSNWAYIEYRPGSYGYAPVQQGYTVVATVKYNVLVICCGSLP